MLGIFLSMLQMFMGVFLLLYLSCHYISNMFILLSLHLHFPVPFRVFTTVVKARRVCSLEGGGGTGSLGTVQPPRDKLNRLTMH
jgi:hypothetical protein